MITLPVAILCGGKGTRLGPLTAHTPKSLVEVAGKPFLAHQLDILKRQGVTKVVLCTGHMGTQILSAIGTYYDGIDVRYSWDGNEPLGHMGALRKVAPVLGPEFIVLYGDSYLDDDYEPIIAAGRKADDPVQAIWNGEDYGITYMTAKALEAMPPMNGLSRLVPLGHALPYIMPRRWYQIGDPEGLAEVRALLESEPGVDSFIASYLSEVAAIAGQIDHAAVEKMVNDVAAIRERNGRLFIVGLGGSAANASHAACDFRKLCEIDAFALTDNMAEFTAAANDSGWESAFIEILVARTVGPLDGLLVLSVGGGDGTRGVSVGLVCAINLARTVGATTLAITGREDGYAAQNCQTHILVPSSNPLHVTPHAESFQAVLWHLLVSHPKLKRNQTKW